VLFSCPFQEIPVPQRSGIVRAPRVHRAVGWLVVVLLSLSGAGRPRASAQTASPLDNLFAAYADGDTQVVATRLQSLAAFRALHLPDEAGLRAWLGPWQRAKAIFVLEVAAAASATAPRQMMALLETGRRYVLSRPSTTPDEDGFEVLWHKTALGLLEQRLAVDREEQYVEALRARYLAGPGTTAADRHLDARFALARGVAQEQRCENLRALRAAATGSAAGAKDAYTACLEEVVRRFVVLPADQVAAEAWTRAGRARLEAGDYAAALTLLDRADTGDDAVLAYWTSLFRARALEHLGRESDAVSAYQAALRAVPGGQSAGVGLALTLFRLNQRERADAAARAVRHMTDADLDPWWIYFSGDGRFVAGWLSALRGAGR
jgi:tetratricopeptide (TPR) repeat protein